MKVSVKLTLDLVESLISENTPYTGTVLLCEIRDSMQTFLRNGLVRGCTVSLQAAFQHAWDELISDEFSDENSDGQKDTFFR